jgi:hypothetical protein
MGLRPRWKHRSLLCLLEDAFMSRRRSKRHRSAAASLVGAISLIVTLAVVSPAAAGFRQNAAHASPAFTDSDGDGLSNSFELHYGLDPNNPDSDGDGLLDPAEDPDHDGLSNLAEQTFGTNPLKADTDGDGISDANEDSNGDGIPNWRQQDWRSIPNPIQPALATAINDWQCYQPGDGSTGQCVGDPTGSTVIAVYGDSHSGQWLPALELASEAHHWRMEPEIKSGCPSVHVPTTASPSFNRDCKAWRQQVELALRSDPPDLVIVSNFSHYGTTDDAWGRGLKALLAALPPASKVMVLADTPLFLKDVPSCLRQHPHDIGACEVPRSAGLRQAHDKLEASIATSMGGSFVSMNPWVCPDAMCPVTVGHLLIWRDKDHLTSTYARQLWPALDSLLPADLPR